MTGASTSNYIAAERGSKPRRPPLIPSTPAPERLTPTGLTTNPSSGQKNQSQGHAVARPVPPQHLATRVVGDAEQPKVDTPLQTYLTRFRASPGGRGGVNPSRPRSGAELCHLPLSQACGPKADQRLRRAYLLGLCASPPTDRRRSLLVLPSTPFHFRLTAAAA